MSEATLDVGPPTSEGNTANITSSSNWKRYEDSTCHLQKGILGKIHLPGQHGLWWMVDPVKQNFLRIILMKNSKGTNYIKRITTIYYYTNCIKIKCRKQQNASAIINPQKVWLDNCIWKASKDGICHILIWTKVIGLNHLSNKLTTIIKHW